MKKILIALLLVVSPLVSPLAMAADPVEGVNYTVVGVEPNKEGKIQVAEFFWYACPHCFAFEPALKEWLKSTPEDVEFFRVPATFNRPHVLMHARTFYALEQMGKFEVGDAIMDAMHNKKRRMMTQEAMEAFLSEQGVDIAMYRQMMDSFVVNLKMQEAVKLAAKYDITGVPSVVVDGEFKVGKAASWQYKTQIMDFLIAKARENRPAAVQPTVDQSASSEAPAMPAATAPAMPQPAAAQ